MGQGCSKSEKCYECHLFTFKETYLNNYQDQDISFIKGVALDVNNHGRKIKIIEDLKGNLTGKSSIFVWGASSTSFCDHKGRQDLRIDYITQYHKNDTLIMLIKNARKRFYGDIERSSDYSTLGGCYSSVLKLSNNSVTVHRTSVYEGMETMPWDEFQELLNSNK